MVGIPCYIHLFVLFSRHSGILRMLSLCEENLQCRLHLIVDCRCLWYQPLLLLNPEFHMNKCDTTSDGHQQPRHTTQAIERCSSAFFFTTCFFFASFFETVRTTRVFDVSNWVQLYALCGRVKLLVKLWPINDRNEETTSCYALGCGCLRPKEIRLFKGQLTPAVCFSCKLISHNGPS